MRRVILALVTFIAFAPASAEACAMRTRSDVLVATAMDQIDAATEAVGRAAVEIAAAATPPATTTPAPTPPATPSAPTAAPTAIPEVASAE